MVFDLFISLDFLQNQKTSQNNINSVIQLNTYRIKFNLILNSRKNKQIEKRNFFSSKNCRVSPETQQLKFNSETANMEYIHTKNYTQVMINNCLFSLRL